ncbi:hypothetical protein ACFL6E_04355 [Candidatus Neomarinimicrobiota bacterium]
MQRLSILVLGLMLTMAGSTELAAQDREKETFKVKPGQTLDVQMESGGSLTITSWNKEEVEVIFRQRRGSLDDYKIDVSETSDGLRITTDTKGFWGDHDGTVDAYVKVPTKFNLDFYSSGGDLKMDGVEGEFDGKTMGGDLDLVRVAGLADLKTMGGDITIRDATLDGRVHTMGGDVDIKNVSGTLKSTSMGGDVRYDNTGTGKSSKPIEMSTMGGDIDLANAPHGAEVKTMGGDISIESARKYIVAKTMGGNIEIREIDGKIKATTMGGDVDVRVVGTDDADRSVDLVSKGGNVVLTVPADLSMDIDITLAYTKRGWDDYAIESDFDLDIERTDKWNYSRGSGRKFIYGKAKFGSGKNKIRIETTNGRIYLKKE